MLASCFRAFVQCCKALVVLSLILLSIGACDDTPPRPRPTDPGTVARQVIADFLALPITEVTLVSLEAQDFNDSSLGCPASGMAYQQVVTPGQRAIVEAQGRRFDVRVAGGHGKICRNDKRSKSKNNAGRKSAVPAMINVARRDLAGLLDVEAPKIRIRDVRPYDGKNAPVGCTPQCAGSDRSCGYIIGLFYDGRRYDYHAADGNATPCPLILRL